MGEDRWAWGPPEDHRDHARRTRIVLCGNHLADHRSNLRGPVRSRRRARITPVEGERSFGRKAMVHIYALEHPSSAARNDVRAPGGGLATRRDLPETHACGARLRPGR